MLTNYQISAIEIINEKIIKNKCETMKQIFPRDYLE